MERDARARCALVEFTRCVLLLPVALLGSYTCPRLVCGAPPGFPDGAGSLQSKRCTAKCLGEWIWLVILGACEGKVAVAGYCSA